MHKRLCCWVHPTRDTTCRNECRISTLQIASVSPLKKSTCLALQGAPCDFTLNLLAMLCSMPGQPQRGLRPSRSLPPVPHSHASAAKLGHAAPHPLACAAQCAATKRTWKMGASASLFTATMHFESFMPARCWMAPDLPKAMYRSGATTLPVWPTCAGLEDALEHGRAASVQHLA